MSVTAGVEVGVLARGRIGWILAIIVGVAMSITGGVLGATKGWSWHSAMPGWFTGVGAAFAVVGLIFLIASYATRGQTD